MGEIFRVNCPGCGQEKGPITTHPGTVGIHCPGCGQEKGPITTHPGTVGIHCSCGVTATVDIGAQEIDEWWERED